MKVGLSMKSDFAFDRVSSELQEYEVRPLKSLEDIKDAVQYYKPDIVILDVNLPYFVDAQKLLLRFHINLIYFEGEFDKVLEEILEQSIFYVEDKRRVEKYIPDHSKYIERLNQEAEQEIGPEIIYQEKIVEKEIEKVLYTSIPSKVIVVGSLYRGSGSTILATNLARMIAKRGVDVAYVEHPLIKPYMYDYLQIHQHTDKKNSYIDLTREIQLEGISWSKKSAWVREGVKWHVIDSTKPSLSSFTYENLLILSHTIQASVMLIDISNRWLDPEIQKFLSIADEVLLCVEPDPIKNDWSFFQVKDYPSPEKQIVDYLEEKVSDQYQLVMMKEVKEIGQSLQKEMLIKKPVASIPYIPYTDYMKALIKSKFLYDTKEHNETFEDNLKPLMANLLPEDLIELKEKEGKLLKMFWKKKVN